jgi:SH3-like domain-containing protein
MHLLRSLVFLAVVASPLAAQSRVTRNAEVRSSPDGNVVADVRSGTTWQTGTARSGWTLIKLQGWVDASRFVGRADSFPESIGGTQTLRIREQPSLDARILGELRPGAGLRVAERRGSWARMQRDAWVQSTTLAAPAPPRTASAPVAPSRDAEPASDTDTVARTPLATPQSPAPAGALRADAATALRIAPTGEVIARLEPGATVLPLARDRGWVRVRLDAWVAESLLTPTDTSFGATLTAADLKLDPVGHKGRVVRWAVEVVGLQAADALRRDLAADEPYLLAMGPGSENAILYIAVPPSLLEEARALAPLAKVLVTARVRTGRSEPTGAPVLELLSLVKR